MKEAVGEVFPDDKYQRCTGHFYRNVFSVVPKSKVKIVAKVLKTIHAYESKKASCGFVFQFIDRRLLRAPEHYSAGKLRSFPTLLSHA